MARLFTGIFPPEETLTDIHDLRMSADGLDVRWMPAENLHATLVFIGPTRSDEVDVIDDALRQVRFDAFDIRFSGVGAFPDAQRARVLWVGIAPSGPIVRLQEKVARALVGTMKHRTSSPRPYHPHISVARSRGKRRIDVRHWIDRHARLEGRPFPVESIALVRSRTKAEGAEYTVIERYVTDSRSDSSRSPS